MSSSESVKHVCVGDDMFDSVCVALTRYSSLMSCLYFGAQLVFICDHFKVLVPCHKSVILLFFMLIST